MKKRHPTRKEIQKERERKKKDSWCVLFFCNSKLVGNSLTRNCSSMVERRKEKKKERRREKKKRKEKREIVRRDKK